MMSSGSGRRPALTVSACAASRPACRARKAGAFRKGLLDCCVESQQVSIGNIRRCGRLRSVRNARSQHQHQCGAQVKLHVDLPSSPLRARSDPHEAAGRSSTGDQKIGGRSCWAGGSREGIGACHVAWASALPMAGVLNTPVTIPAAVNEVHAVGAQCAAGQQWSAHPSPTSVVVGAGIVGGLPAASALASMPWQGIPSESGVVECVCVDWVRGEAPAAVRASEMGCAQPGVHDDATSGIATSPRHMICRMRRRFIGVSLPQQHMATSIGEVKPDPDRTRTASTSVGWLGDPAVLAEDGRQQPNREP